MANTTEQILLTIGAKNNASSIASQIDKDFKSMASSISSSLTSINQGMMNLGAVTDNVMQGLTGKSALDNIFGTSNKAETNKVLLKNMSDTEKGAEKLYDTVDKVTDSSLTSMQELIPAMKAFKSATGASDKEMTNITDEMANFGAAVLAQTGSTDLAQQSMMDLSKGIKGAFASLDQYGITQAALERTGYWNGDEKDVEGFMRAVQKVTGSTEELMETNQGLDALIGKAFSRAGKKIGNEFLPVIKDVKRGFLDLDDALGGNLTASILAVSGGVEVMNQGLWNVSTSVQGFKDLSEGASFLINKIKGVEKAAESAGDALNTMSNVSDIGAGATGVGAQAIQNTSKSEKAFEGGMDALLMGDMLKSSKKDTEKLEKEAKDLFKERGEIMEKIHNFDGKKDSKKFKDLQRLLSKNDLELAKGIDGHDPIDLLRKNKSTKELSSKEISTLFGSLDDTLDVANTSFTKNIKQKLLNFKNNLGGVFSIGLGDIGSSIKNKFSSLGSSLSNIKNFNLKDSLSGLKKSFTGLKGTKEVASGIETVSEVGTALSAAGPEMAAASAGAETAAAGATGLSAAFTSMIVPLLAISAVIIIMIPIVSVIAAEAMIFIRLLADFMEALNFDNINLDGAIKGISQVATALGWVGVAMGAMTFTSIMTGLAVITSGFLGITGPLDIAINALKDAAKKLMEFGNISINPSIATNLKTISDSLMAVSSAMGALTWTNITTGFSNWIAGALGFGSITEGLEQAKNDIIDASKKINEFSTEITPLDDNAAQNIQNVCNSLASVGDAMGALRSIRDSQNWDEMIAGLIGGIFGEGVDIQTALNNAKLDIENASKALSEWNNLEQIPEGIGDKIKNVAEALTNVKEAFDILRGFRDDNIWDEMIGGLFQGKNIQESLGQVVSDINAAASQLNQLQINDINEDLIKKIQNVVNALTEVSNVANGLTNLPPMEGFDSSKITSVMSNVQTASDALNNLNVGEINEETINNIKNVASALTEVSSVMTTLTTLPPMGDGFDSSNIATAVANVQTAATELSKISSIALGEDVNSVLGSINTALQTLKDTLANASGFSESSVNIGSQIVSGVQTGLAPLSGMIQSSVGNAINSAKPTANTYGKGLGFNATNGFKSELKLANVMTTEMGYVKSAVDNGISAAKSAAESGAKDIVAAFKDGIHVGSPGDIARTMEQEMIYTKDFILGAGKYLKKSSYDVARTIVNAFGNPEMGVSLFNNNRDLNAFETPISKVPYSSNNRQVIIEIHEGAVMVDARNKTEKEAKGLMTLALEGMDIPDINF